MAGPIPSDFIDQLLNRVDIVDVIDSRVPLRKAGREFQACCPFHEEKTPSFTVSPAKQFYHCFGCGEHGSAIGFLMKYANLSFVEAVEQLADAAGLPVPREQRRGAGDRATAAQAAPLLEVVAAANQWFQRQLREAHGQPAIAYLKQRGLDGRTAADFGIGYAPDGWHALADALGGDGAKCRQLQKAGLLMRRETAGGRPVESGGGGEFYDRFRNRVMFPIEDHRGRVVGFGGRILGDGEPKYLNSPETPLFHKGAELYGLHRARQAIGRAGRSIVVEGYMDVVALAQFGVGNAVATLGTATTRTHIQRLFRLAPGIVFCFDGDRAGRAAAWKAMQAALPEMRDGRRAAFLFLPEGEDPDSVVRAEGGDGFARRVDAAKTLEDFLFDELIEQVNMTPAAGGAELATAAKPLLAKLPNESLREALNNRLRTETGLVKHLHETEALDWFRRQRAKTGPAAHRVGDERLQPLALAISLLLQNPRLAASIAKPRELRQLHQSGSQVLLALLDKIAADPAITTARLLEAMRHETRHARLEELAARPHLIADGALESQFNDAIDRLLEQHTERRRLRLIEQIRQAPDAAEKQKWQRQLKALLDARKGAQGAGGADAAAGEAAPAPKTPDQGGRKAAGL